MTPDRGAWAPDRRLLTAGLIGLVTAAAFEGMAVPTVLPAMVRELGGLDLYGWAFSAFWLTNIIGITLAGSDADRQGPARSLIVGTILFAGGMVVSGLADGMPAVIAGRAIQGFGSGAIGSVVYAAIARAYAPTARPRMIALVSSAWVVPGLVGPALAGFVADAASWRWVFLGIVVPVLVMGAAVYPQLASLGRVERTTQPARRDSRRALDAAQLAAGSTLILTALSIGHPILAPVLLVGGAVIALTALRHLLPPGSLRLAPGRPSVVVAVFAVAFAFFGTEAYVPLTVVEVRDGSVTLGGIALSASAVTWTTGAWIQARAAAASIRRTVVVVGSALIGLGIAITSLVLLPAAPLLVAALGWGVAGLGMGLAYSMLALLMLESAPPGEEGISSAALQLMFTLGTAFGAGAGGAVIALADAGTLELPGALGIVNGIMLVVAVAAVLVALRVPPRPSPAVAAADLARAAVPLEHP
ncbi:MAG TPA: MFS transporter [Patescibacteria group bacterium]|nr:MFS transporter [Patescibacteria group bacterium]